MLGILHHLFIPRESNNHRAKILHHSSLLVVITFLIIGNIFLNFIEAHHSSVLGITASYNTDDLLLLTNKERVDRGLPPLQLNSELTQAAQQKGQDMFAKNYWAHNSPDGMTPWVFIKGSGYDYLYAGENLARGYTSASDVVNAWMNSEGHRENLLSPNYDDVGFAVLTGSLTGDETILVVQEFGRKIAGAPVQTIALATTPTPPAVQVTQIPTKVPVVVQVTSTPPTATPIPVPSITASPNLPVHEMVASVQNQPLVDSKTFSENFALMILVLFISVLLVDMIIVERKKIVRVLSHNVDHVIFLTIILVILLLLGRGMII